MWSESIKVLNPYEALKEDKHDNTKAVSMASDLINNFLSVEGRKVYVVNPDGSTFTLESGCMLLTVDNSHMPVLMEE